MAKSQLLNARVKNLEEVLKKLVQEVRIVDNRKAKNTFTVIDAQSIKNTDTAKNKGYDAGKKVSGIKRHIAVDTNGLPHAMYITTRNGAIDMLKKYNDNLSQVQNILVDAGYSGEKLLIQCLKF